MIALAATCASSMSTGSGIALGGLCVGLGLILMPRRRR